MNRSNSCYLNAFNLKLPLYRTAVSTVYSATSVTAVSLNLLVFITIWKTPSLHKPSYVLLANLALADLLVGAVVQPLTVVINVAALKNWTKVFCLTSSAAYVVGYWLGSVSLFTLTVISIDRLLAIKLKNRYRTIVSLKRIIWSLVFWWIKALVVTVMNIFIKGKPSGMLFIVPAVIISGLLVIITICYSIAFHSLRKLTTTVVTGSVGEQPPNPNINNFGVYKYRRSLNTMLLVFISIMLFYLPYLCSVLTISVTFKGELNWRQDGKASLYLKSLVLSELFVVLISTINPLLCLWRVKDLRKAAKKKIRETFKPESTQ